MRTAMILGALALAGCTPSAEMQASDAARAERELSQALAGRTPGEPRDCISTSDTEGPQIIDGDTILYKPVGRTVWRNELGYKCPALAPYKTLIVEVHGGQLCRNDRFRVLEPGSTIPSGYCSFGKFTPYVKQ